MRIEVLGAGGAVNGDRSVTGQALGGRRARVALIALAVARQPVSAERLANIIWGEELPATWPVALRGIVSGLRTALEPLDGGAQRVIVTAPPGYALARDVHVDLADAEDDVRTASDLLAQGRHQAAYELAEPITALSGDQLLAGEDADWLAAPRRAIDATALRAAEIVVHCAGALGEHHVAVAAGRRAVAANPLDERAHRALLAALDESGDRAGVVRAYEQCRAVLADQLGIDPSAETVEVYLSALRDQHPSAPGRLPAPTSTFVGRRDETAALDSELTDAGLITVSGKGGVGKSRLAARVASAATGFEGGRLWVSLAPVAEDALVASTVALELGVPLGTDDATAALADHLAPLGRTLLVLDGCEGVVDGVASLASALLAGCPLLSLVATSRVPLAVDGERVFVVEPLPPPDGEDDGLLDSDQVRLLVDRVREGGGDLEPDPALVPHLAALCRRCGGLPLALELAAAQLAAMPVGDLLDHLGDVLADGEDRLRTVARAGYELLDDDEATVFRRFAVLDGPVGLPLLREVVTGPGIAPVRVVRILRELTARGLLQVDRTGPRWRYQQDDDLHRFARELLVEHGGERAGFDQLASAISALLPEDARAAPAPFQDSVTDALAAVRGLFGAGLDGRADHARCLELAFRLHRYFAATNVAEGRFWLSRLLADRPATEWTAYATWALGYLSYWLGDTDNAVRELTRVVEMLDGHQDPYYARALIYLAGLVDDLDRGTEAVEYVRRAIDAAAPFGTDLQVAAAMGLGSVLSERADPEAARFAAEAIALCAPDGSSEQLATALPTAAMVCWQVGAIDEAAAYLERARPLHAGTKRIARVVMLSAAAGVALARGDVDAAVDFGTTADREASELGVEREVPLVRAVLARALLARGDVGAAVVRIAGAIEVARAMTITYPLAICLETAALVCRAAGTATDADLADLLATAGLIRSRGDRPSPPTLRPAVELLAAAVGAGTVLEPDVAAGLALDRLGVSLPGLATGEPTAGPTAAG